MQNLRLRAESVSVKARAQSVINIFLPGGIAAQESFDPKILAPIEYRGPLGTVKLWEMQDGRQMKNWTAHGPGALSVCFAHDGRLVCCGRDLAVTLWNANGGKVRSFEFAGELPIRAVFSQDDQRVFATDFAGRVAAWTTNDGKRVGELNANPLRQEFARAKNR